MATAVKIYADRTNRRLVVAPNKAVEKRIDSPYKPCHQDKISLAVQPLTLNPTGGESAPYTEEDGGGYTITVAVFSSDGITTLAGPSTLSGTEGFFKTGFIDLFTAAMSTAIGSGLTLTSIIEFTLTNSDSVTTIQQELKINRKLNVTGTPSATPGVRYLTEADGSRFVKYADNPDGATIELNKSGVIRIISVESDASAGDSSGT